MLPQRQDTDVTEEQQVINPDTFQYDDLKDKLQLHSSGTIPRC